MTRDFGLIETMLFVPGEGIWLEAAHWARLAASAAQLGFRFDEAAARDALTPHIEAQPGERLRLRLVLRADGTLEPSATVLPGAEAPLLWRVRLAAERVNSAEPLLAHKTTFRARYERPLAAAGTDEVIFLNERDEVCEGARSNVFVERGGVLLTPPRHCGLLPGTLRAALLDEGKAREEVLHREDLSDGTLYLGNSVRGLVRAALV